MAWALLRSLRKLTNRIRHSCDQDKQEHIAGLAENMSARASSTTPGQCGNGLVTLQAERLGREVGFFAPPDACRLTQSDWVHCMEEATFEAQKVDTPKDHLASLDHRSPRFDWRICDVLCSDSATSRPTLKTHCHLKYGDSQDDGRFDTCSDQKDTHGSDTLVSLTDLACFRNTRRGR